MKEKDNYEDIEVDPRRIREVEREIDSRVPGHEEDDDEDEYDDFPNEDDGPAEERTILTKYRVEAEIPQNLQKDFDNNASFFGRHVALSNTPRSDNPKHLDAMDLCAIYRNIPMLRQRATEIKCRETSEYQMCRSNERIGGFEAELGLVNISRQDANVRHFVPFPQSPKHRFLGFLRRNPPAMTGE